MTGRSDYGSAPWRHPALLSYQSREDTAPLRRGSQADIRAALRRLQAAPPAGGTRPVPLGTRLAAWVLGGRDE